VTCKAGSEFHIRFMYFSQQNRCFCTLSLEDWMESNCICCILLYVYLKTAGFCFCFVGLFDVLVIIVSLSVALL